MSSGITVRPRCPRRSLHDPHALTGQDIIERARELSVAIPDEEPELADPAGEVHDQVAACRGSPPSDCVPGHPEDVTRRVAASIANSILWNQKVRFYPGFPRRTSMTGRRVGAGEAPSSRGVAPAGVGMSASPALAWLPAGIVPGAPSAAGSASGRGAAVAARGDPAPCVTSPGCIAGMGAAGLVTGGSRGAADNR